MRAVVIAVFALVLAGCYTAGYEPVYKPQYHHPDRGANVQQPGADSPDE